MVAVPVSKLSLYPGNARRGNIDLIADSLGKLGQYKPIVVNKGNAARDLTNVVLAGNHTLQAAQKLGWSKIDVHWVDVDAETAKRIVLIDNRANDKAGYDLEALADLLTELPDLDATGYVQDDVDRMLDQLGTQAIKAAESLNDAIGLDAGRTVAEDGPSFEDAYGDEDEDAAGAEFAEFDDEISTEYRCPKCDYEWSGRAR